MLTAAQLTACMPGAPDARAEKYLKAFNRCFDTFKIDTPVRQAAFLAQVGHESASMRYTEEIASGQAYTSREDLGNTLPPARAYACADEEETGPFYKGHGMIQITGYNNHRAYSQWCYDDNRCVVTPSLLILPRDAIRSAGWFWTIRSKLNEVADQNTDSSFQLITSRINGGLNGLVDRRARWAICKKVLGA